MNDQRGVVVLGIMVVMMGVMMLFSGMHMMHGGHGPEDHAQIEHRHDHDKIAHGRDGSVDETVAVSDQRKDQ